MEYGTQANIARQLGISRQQINDYLAGRKNASVDIADKLAAITKTNIRLWLKGGDPVARKAAVENAKLSSPAIRTTGDGAAEPPLQP